MPHSDWPQTLRGHPGSLFAAALLTIFAAATNLQAQVFTSVTELDLPTGPGAQAPDLFASKDGRITLVWSAPDDAGFAVRMTTGNATGWGPVKTITASRKLFVNWADFPSIAVLDDGTIAAHWLQENGPSSYDYDLNI
ncbi:MAG TPA: exo-alpha-sialidase, partial [Aliiroseovarius sp.]|nr:exo-alpha-sialidase [Aliiroseovarius sp.]